MASKAIESGWLAALIIVPVLFNVYTERVFEEDKIPLLRSIALLIAAGLVIWRVERGPDAFRIAGRPLWKVPLVLPTLALTGAYLLSTLFSIVPRISFWGAYIRREGTFTWLSYIAIFFAILLLVRQRKQVERIVSVILLTSVPVSLYAFLQHSGLDPLPWGGDVVTRVSSTLGNPIFLAAYLIMVVPLTLARLIEHGQRLLRPDAKQGDEGILGQTLLAGSYLFLLLLQMVSIIYTQSRGPWLGLGVGLVFFGILFVLQRSRLMTLAITAATVAGIAFLVVFNLPNSPLESMREAAYIGRLGQIFETDSGTGRVRVLIWEGASQLLASNPVRSLVGYGPEAMYVAYNPYYPPELGQIEERNASPDRSHNETFDALVMTGVIGFAAQTALFLALFYYVLRWLGIIATARQKHAFLAATILGAAGGLLVPYFLEGSFRMSGVGLPAGITLGLLCYLLGYALLHVEESHPERPASSLLLIALLSAVIAHFVEIHFGIAIAATRLYFWVYAALALVTGLMLVEEAQAEPRLEAANARRLSRRKRQQSALPLGVGWRFSPVLGVLSAAVGLLVIVLTFNFLTPAFDWSTQGLPLGWLFLGTWLFGAIFVIAEVSWREETGSTWQEHLGQYALVSIGMWVTFCLVYVPWVNWRPDDGGALSIEALRAQVSHIANSITLVYLAVLAVVAFITFTLQYEEQVAPLAPSRAPTWRKAGYGALLLGLIPVIVGANLNVSRADAFSKQAISYENAGQWEAARVLHAAALHLQPDEDRYFLNMGRVLMNAARSTQDMQQRDLYLTEARAVLERARTVNPLNTDHSRNLATLHRVWASLVTDEAVREQHLARSDEYYAQAVELSPNNPSVWNAWADLDISRGKFEEALDKLQYSMDLDSRFLDTYMLRATVAIQQEQYDEALAIYEQALTSHPRSLRALSGKAFALTKMNRIEEAIAVNQEALAVAPNDYTTHKNLALLYEEAGLLDEALASAQAALTVASDADQPAMQQVVQRLTEQRTTRQSDG